MTSTIPLIDVLVQPIELCKLLKIANMVNGGGEAKIVISEGYVLLNGELEFQKRKKVYHNDIVEFNGDIIQVNVIENNEKTKPLAKKTTKHSTCKNPAEPPHKTTKKHQRKAISF